MKIIGKVKSWNGDVDCFGYSKPANTDHIWPEDKGGSSSKHNLQILSIQANKTKYNKTKGKIGDQWRFSIIKKQTQGGLIYGVMYIRKQDWEHNTWKEVVPEN